jgi:hypothetical protein
MQNEQPTEGVPEPALQVPEDQLEDAPLLQDGLWLAWGLAGRECENVYFVHEGGVYYARCDETWEDCRARVEKEVRGGTATRAPYERDT